MEFWSSHILANIWYLLVFLIVAIRVGVLEILNFDEFQFINFVNG